MPHCGVYVVTDDPPNENDGRSSINEIPASFQPKPRRQTNSLSPLFQRPCGTGRGPFGHFLVRRDDSYENRGYLIIHHHPEDLTRYAPATRFWYNLLLLPRVEIPPPRSCAATRLKDRALNAQPPVIYPNQAISDKSCRQRNRIEGSNV